MQKETRLATRKTYYLASALSEGGGSDAKGGDSGGQSLLHASGDLEAVGLHGHGCKTTGHIYTLFSGTLIERKLVCDKNCTLSVPVPSLASESDTLCPTLRVRARPLVPALRFKKLDCPTEFRCNRGVAGYSDQCVPTPARGCQ